MSCSPVVEAVPAPSYQELTRDFDWSVAERELEYKPGDRLNIGWMCSDRICRLGMAGKVALDWENFQGNRQRFTFDDLRVLSNTFAQFICDLGVQPGERVCLFMDRVPELYIGFLGILKTGAVAQPLFSAFGDESLLVRLQNAGTSVILTQKKHVHKVRKIRERLPSLRQIVVVDAGDSPLQEREVAFDLAHADPAAGVRGVSHNRGVAIRSALHLRHHRPAERRAARPLLHHLAVSDSEMGIGSPAR